MNIYVFFSYCSKIVRDRYPQSIERELGCPLNVANKNVLFNLKKVKLAVFQFFKIEDVIVV